jgi:aldehyde:ferredoxin oxidoreductase
MMGDVPLQNWLSGTWDDEAFQALDGTAMEATILTGTPTCHSCSIACKRQVAVREGPYPVAEGPGPEYETLAAFGGLTLTRDLNAIAKANELCNRYGMDTISCGATIAFAIEATERGLLRSDLGWGKPTELLAMVEDIGQRRGVGNLLAEGSRRAAAALGPEAAEMAVEVKGLEVAMHSPRAYHGLGIGYATAPRGACHNAANVYFFLGSVLYPELGLEEPLAEQSSEGKGQASAKAQDIAGVLNAASFCMLNSLNYSVTQVAQALSAVTGFSYTVGDVARAGERLWHLKHGINILLGATAADDRLPSRLVEPLTDGPTAGSVPDMPLMLAEFYAVRGLDAAGRPAPVVLAELGLADLARRLA